MEYPVPVHRTIMLKGYLCVKNVTQRDPDQLSICDELRVRTCCFYIVLPVVLSQFVIYFSSCVISHYDPLPYSLCFFFKQTIIIMPKLYQ